MTDKVTIHIDTFGNENVIIDRGNDEFTSMPKAIYDELQKAIDEPTDETKAK